MEDIKTFPWKKTILISLLLIILGGLGAGAYFYSLIYSPNVPANLESPYVMIPTGSTFDEVVSLLKDENFIIEEESFRWTANKRGYNTSPMRSGRFKIQSGWNNYELIGHLKAGRQETIKLTFHNKRKVENVAGHISQFIEPDSLSILTLLQDSIYLKSIGYRPETAMAIFIPNTYQIFWNTSAKGFIEKMLKENNKFWTESRQNKAKKLGLSLTEVYTLASIVESETKYNPEKSRVAGVYLNRIKKGWFLGADPTVVFAVNDFTIRRVLNKHLEFDSPYNTYKNLGLPPGPIYMASISSIDRTLDAEDHDYMFFCAKPGYEGAHNFAKTNQQHNNNARKYHRWLNKQNIKK